jgi:hypothetical protein
VVVGVVMRCRGSCAAQAVYLVECVSCGSVASQAAAGRLAHAGCVYHMCGPFAGPVPALAGCGQHDLPGSMLLTCCGCSHARAAWRMVSGVCECVASAVGRGMDGKQAGQLQQQPMGVASDGCSVHLSGTTFCDSCRGRVC